jgi:hypothetical protein
MYINRNIEGFVTGRNKPPSEASKADPGAAQTPEQIEEATAEGTHRAQLALARIQQREACDRAKAACVVAEDAYKEASSFDELTNRVLQGEEGRAVAASPRHLTQYIALQEARRPTRVATDRLRAAASDLLKPLAASLADPNDATLPPAPLMSEVATVDSQARDALDAYRTAREQLEAIVAEAKASGAKGDVPLRDAVARRHNEEAREAAEKLEQARKKAREAADAQIAAAEAEKARIVAAKEIEVKKAQLKAELEQKERERKRQLAGSPAVQAAFMPLLAKGRWLYKKVEADGPRPHHWSKFALPASVSALASGGYLADLEGFALAMSGYTYTWHVGEFNTSCDRPRVKYPQTPDEWQKMDELYKLFLDISPVWVEMGLLEK